MTAVAVRLGGPIGSAGRRLGRFWSGISAVSIKELRGRMRGRRAFVVLTVYLLLLGLFAFAIYVYLKSQAAQVVVSNIGGVTRDFPGMPFPGGQTLGNGTALSAGIGHGIFGGLLLLETLLVLVLAPAFTTGAISLEREKQTIDMLVTTPLSTLGMVVGKLFSALVYVLLLIIASIPLASLVFVFGGVGPEDLVRAYVFLFALAFGMGAIGPVHLGARAADADRDGDHVRRRAAAVHRHGRRPPVLAGNHAADFEQRDPHAAARQGARGSAVAEPVRRRPRHDLRHLARHLPPLVRVHQQRHRPTVFRHSERHQPAGTGVSRRRDRSPGTARSGPQPGGIVNDTGVAIDAPAPAVPDCPPGALCVAPAPGIGIAKPAGPPTSDPQVSAALSLGFPRDTFWPKSAAAFVGVGIVLTLLSAQLVSPTRRLRLPRPHLPRRRRGGAPPADPTTEDTNVQPTDTAPTEASA